ncbi:MAG: 3-hydroxyacyl-CoA dehydrogenase family protein, partial [Pseudomonadota bacterium]
VPYMNRALEAYDQGLATKEDLDLTLEMGLGYPTGPLRLVDKFGLDEYLKMTTAFYEESKDPKFAPPVILKRMVGSGKLGKKVGEGFYSYHPKTGEKV